MKNLRLLWLPSLFLIGLWACDSQTIDPNTAPARLHVYLTDGPGDYQQVNIDLLQVRIKTKGSSGWVDLATNQGIYDLLQYQAGDDTLIVNDTLPPGEIQEIRLVLGPNNSVMVDSVLYPLATPSAQQSGLKIKLQSFMYADSLTNL
ncbi:MAG: DUF4382 domain-containing protein, partial [Bacteroidia bacterium]|nr:DUF4382 domain-containing protein [Bacteroidia bacterium]